VRANQEVAAKLAMQHFRERGFTRFAYCGIPSERIWPPTGEIFRGLAKASSHRCDVYLPSYHTMERPLRLTHLAEWLKSLQLPVGVLAANDLRAREVLDACQLVGLHVPEEIAVMGMNDDELICEMANPPLSSVIHNARRVGYEAAAMLDRMLGGEIVTSDVVVDPTGVHARQSTDLLAIEDPEVAKALRFIRENACGGICVDDVLEVVTTSRRSLEKRFRDDVGRPLHVEILRVQIERSKELLATTDYKLEKVAEMTGFSTAQYFAGVFHKIVGMTPGTWRGSTRSHGAAGRYH
jgi:LacI family transcriptional regulator